MIVRRRIFDAVVAAAMDQIARLEAGLSDKLESLTALQSAEASRAAERLAQLVAAIDAINARVDNLATTTGVQHDQNAAQFGDLLRRLNDTTLAERVEGLDKEMKAQAEIITTQILNRLATDFADLGRTVGRLDNAVAKGSAQIAARVDDGFAGLGDLTQRLDNAVAKGSAQIAARVDDGFAGLGDLTQRLDRDVVGAFSALAARLDNDFGQFAGLVRQLDVLGAELKAQADGNLAQAVQHLDGAAADRSTQIAARIEDGFAGLAERLDRDVAGAFSRLAARLDDDLGELAGATRQIDGNLAEAIQRLDGAVAAGVAQIASRLESDLGKLTRAARRIDALGVAADGAAQVTARVDQNLGELTDLARRIDALGVAADGAAQVTARVDQNLGELTDLARRIDALGVAADGAAQVTARVDQNLGELTDLARRIDALGVAADGAAQVTARLDQNLGELTDLARRIDALGVAADGAAQVTARVDQNLGELTDLARRLDRDLASGFAQLSDRIPLDLGNLSGFTQRLDSDVVGGFSQIAARLENDLGNLADFTRRLDRDLASGLAQLSDRLTRDLGHFGDFTQRLDRAVSGGFSAVTDRLENDLAQLTTRVHEVSAFMRFSSGTVSKLVLDQSDLSDRLRDLHRGMQIGSNRAPVSNLSSLPAPLAASVPTLCPLSEAAIPLELRAAIGEEGWDTEQLQCLPIVRTMTVDALSGLLDTVRAARVAGAMRRPLAWALPPSLSGLLSHEESNQIFGVLGPPGCTRDITTPEGEWRLILGHTRAEAFSIAVRWSLSALEQFYFRLKPLFEEALNWAGLNQAFHAIDIPDLPDAFDDWKAAVSELIPLLARDKGTVFGIVLPQHFDDHPYLTAEAVAFLQAALRETGFQRPLSFQWVRGGVPLSHSRKIVKFAEDAKIMMDCTPVQRGSTDGGLEAYDGFVPYRPSTFDLRLPSFDASSNSHFVTPRHSGREFMLTHLDGEAASGLRSMLDGEFDHSLRRLVPVLDRNGRAQFEAQVNFDKTLMSLWPEYFVFNWPAPSAARLCLFEFDAAELVSSASPLARLKRIGLLTNDDSLYVPALQFFDIAHSVALRAPPTGLERRSKQVKEHAYLSERTRLTADAELLTNWMPKSLGVTLELGSGYGAMARAVRPRASTYTGIDLTPGQARLLSEMDAAGLVGDIQQLPFADDSYDTVVADNVVEHSQDPVGTLREAYRVLRPGGSAFLIIPHDYFTSRFQNAAHLWKADEASVQLAIGNTGFVVARQQTVRLAELGVPGAHPSSGGTSGLWHLLKEAPRPSKPARKIATSAKGRRSRSAPR